MYSIVIDMPHLADGAELHIDGLGTFTKGGDNYVTDEAANIYQQFNVGHEPALAFDYDEKGNKVEDTEHQVGVSQVQYSLPELMERFQGIKAVEILDVDVVEENPADVKADGNPVDPNAADTHQDNSLELPGLEDN